MQSQSTARANKPVTNGSLLDRVIAETQLPREDESYAIARRGVGAFISELLKPHNRQEPVKKALVDRMIAEIDSKLSRQVDA
ncbi:MAG TPA: type VI secretion system contractile sheath large subunit, partial [Pseudomonas sp.]|nr:type VI secretion system contractile sheath large subunit [Pseudomonas sp.]